MRISDWSSDVCSSDLVTAIGSSSTDARQHDDFPCLGQLARPVRLEYPIDREMHTRRGDGGETGREPIQLADQIEQVMRRQIQTPIVDELAEELLVERRHHHDTHRASPFRMERSEEHTSELQSLMRNSYAVFCLKKKTKEKTHI